MTNRRDIESMTAKTFGLRTFTERSQKFLYWKSQYGVTPW